jgi:hypothetical protein
MSAYMKKLAKYVHVNDGLYMLIILLNAGHNNY